MSPRIRRWTTLHHFVGVSGTSGVPFGYSGGGPGSLSLGWVWSKSLCIHRILILAFLNICVMNASALVLNTSPRVVNPVSAHTLIIRLKQNSLHIRYEGFLLIPCISSTYFRKSGSQVDTTDCPMSAINIGRSIKANPSNALLKNKTRVR